MHSLQNGSLYLSSLCMKIPMLDVALAIVSYNAANLIVSWIDHHSGDKADDFADYCVPMLHLIM